MPVTKVQSKFTAGTTSSLSVILDAAPTAGNIIVAVAGTNTNLATQNMTAPGTGWGVVTEALAAASTNAVGIYARKVASGEGSTYTLQSAASSAVGFLHVYEFSGVGSLALSIPATNYGSTGPNASGTSAATPSATPNAGSSGYVLAGIWWAGGSVTLPSASGFTTTNSANPGSGIRGASAELSVASASGSYNTTFSWTTSRASATAIMFIQDGSVLSVSVSESIIVNDTPSLYLDGYIITETENIAVVDIPQYYDDLVIVGDRVTISVETVSGADQFFAWFG